MSLGGPYRSIDFLIIGMSACGPPQTTAALQHCGRFLGFSGRASRARAWLSLTRRGRTQCQNIAMRYLRRGCKRRSWITLDNRPWAIEELLLRWLMSKDDIAAMRAAGPAKDYVTTRHPLVKLMADLTQHADCNLIQVSKPGFALTLERSKQT